MEDSEFTKAQSSTEKGLSLMELVITVGLVSLGSMLVGQFMSHLSKQQASTYLRQEMTSKLKIFLDKLDRDLLLRVPNAGSSTPDLCGDGATECQKISFQRYADTTSTQIPVSYQTQCQTFTSNQEQGQNTAMANIASSPCLQKIQCPTGQLPQIGFTVSGGDRLAFAYEGRHIKYQVISSAVCFEIVDNSILKISAEILFKTPNLGSQIFSKEMLRSIKKNSMLRRYQNTGDSP